MLEHFSDMTFWSLGCCITPDDILVKCLGGSGIDRVPIITGHVGDFFKSFKDDFHGFVIAGNFCSSVGGLGR